MRPLKVATRARPFSPNQDEVTRGRFAFRLKQPKVNKFYELIFEILDIIQLSFHDKWEANKVDPLAAWATAVRRLPSCVLGGGARLAPSWEAGLGAGLREQQRAESQWGQSSGAEELPLWWFLHTYLKLPLFLCKQCHLFSGCLRYFFLFITSFKQFD